MADFFDDREDAGRALSARLKRDVGQTVVLAIPPGAVPVAFEVAKAMLQPMDIIVLRNVVSPWNPDENIGFVSEDGDRLLTTGGSEGEEVEEAFEDEVDAAQDLGELWRDGREPLSLEGMNAILVDDGTASASLLAFAHMVLSRRGAVSQVFAAPVASEFTLETARMEFDEVVCLEELPRKVQVSAWYGDFSEVSDEDVAKILTESDLILRARRSGKAA